MAHLIFRLRQVPDDEAEDVRQLLSRANIDFYETDAGNWGISMPGLWLTDADDAEQAQQLIDDYQQERATKMRDQAVTRSFVDNIAQRPLYTLGLLLFCVALIYFMVKPFLALFT